MLTVMVGLWEKKSDWKEILKQIDEIRLNKETYQQIKLGLKQISIETIEGMLEHYKDLYGRYLASDSIMKAEKEIDNDYILKAYLNANGTKQLAFFEDEEAAQRLEYAEAELQSIKNSVAYKVSVVLENMNIPFKGQLKKVAYKIFTRMKNN